MDYLQLKEQVETAQERRRQKIALLPPFEGKRARELEALRAELTSSSMQPPFSKGLDLAFEDLERHLSKVELQAIQDECLAGIAQWAALDGSSPSDQPDFMRLVENSPDTMQGLLGLSEKTMDALHQAGTRYFENGLFEEAKAVFWMLLALSPLRHTLWIALGFTAKQSGHIKEALDYFTNAILLAPEDLIPYMQAAECHLALHEKTLAEHTLKGALEITPIESQKDLPQEIRNWLASPTFT